jgi:isopenicillin N synthase-like dioxygenase
VKLPGTKEWVDALPLDGALIMNIGDVLARWSNSMKIPPLLPSQLFHKIL